MRNSPLNLYEKRDAGQVLSATLRFIRANGKQLFKIVGLMTLPLILLSSTFSSLNYSSLSSLQENPYFSFSTAGGLFSVLSAYLAYLCMCWGIAYFLLLHNEKGKDNFELGDVWNLVFQHGWKLFFVLLIYLALFVLVSFFAVFISLVTVVLIPFIFFVLLLLMVPLTLMPLVYLTEQEGFFHTIDRTFFLLRGRMLSGMGIILISFILFGMWIIAPSYFLTMLMTGFQENIFHSGFSIPLFVALYNLIQVISVAAYFFVQLAFGIFYYSLAEQKDYVSLKSRIEAIGSNAAQPSENAESGV
jgi:MFS family permease